MSQKAFSSLYEESTLTQYTSTRVTDNRQLWQNTHAHTISNL